jgi:MFS family permease
MTQTTTETLYCYVHPTRETGLRCNNCNRPICAECAVHTPTGYRCRECVKMQQKIFDTALPRDYIFGFIVAALLSLGAAFLVTIVIGIGFGILGWFLLLAGAPTAGVIIAEAVRRVTQKRRSRPLFITVAAGVIAGALPIILGALANGSLYPILFQALYLVLVVPTVFYRLSGIQMSR